MIGFVDLYLQQELDKFDAFLDNPMPEKEPVNEHTFPCRKITPDGKEYFEAVFGDRAHILPPVNDVGQGVVISSSRIRSLLAEGRMSEAVHLLGHPFVLRAPVMHGKALGRTIGLPTANQNFSACHIIPACGIYATRIRIGGKSYVGVTNVGKRPTVEDSDRINCETHILDFNGSLYGEVITTEFYTKLRDEKRFESLAALTEAIRADALAARRYFAAAQGDRI